MTSATYTPMTGRVLQQTMHAETAAAQRAKPCIPDHGPTYDTKKATMQNRAPVHVHC